MYQEAELRQLLDGTRAAAGLVYDSRFSEWEQRSSVRRRPRRIVTEQPSGPWFPPELYPVVSHPLLRRLGPEVGRLLLLHRLYDYLDFTTELESIAVIPVATMVSRRRSGLLLPAQMEADAFKIATDEAWHAQFSDDFARQVAHVTGVRQVVRDSPRAFSVRLDHARANFPRELQGIESLLFAIVSETLISGLLSDIPRDQRLPAPVRDLVRDHAEDEGRHHVYFRSLLRHLWAALDRDERRAVGRQVPGLIRAFLEPDYQQTAVHLSRLGLSPDEIEQVVRETWPEPMLSAEMSEAARPTIRYFAGEGALDDQATYEAFEQAGLLKLA